MRNSLGWVLPVYLGIVVMFFWLGIDKMVDLPWQFYVGFGMVEFLLLILAVDGILGLSGIDVEISKRNRD